MYNLFNLVRLISVKDDVDPVQIKSYAWRQHGEASLLALACSNGFIVLWYRSAVQQPVVKQLPWPPDHPITSMCFDPTVSWLLVQTDNGNIFIIPALAMMDPDSQVNRLWRLDDVTIITSLKPRGTPTVTIWWNTLDGQQIAIVATKLGELLFVNLLTQEVVTETSVDVHISHLDLAQDDQQTATQLLVTGKSGQQWKMLLEKRSTKVQTTDSEIADMGYESIDGMSLPIESLLIKAGHDIDEEQFQPQDISKFSRSVTLAPQYAKGSHFITAHCDKTSTYQVYDSSLEHSPMFVYSLPLGSLSVILTDRILFATSKLAGDQKLLVLSNQRAETSGDNTQAFNKDAIMQQFELPPEDKLLTILPKSFPFYWHEKLEERIGKLSHDQADRRSTASDLEQSYDQSRVLSPFEIPLSCHTVLDGCIVISSTTVYECRPRISPERLFLELCINQPDAAFAEQLGISLSLDLNFLFEEAADYLLLHGNSKQAARLFHMSKGSPVQRVSSFAKYGYIHEILPYLQQLLAKSSSALRQEDRKQLSDLALHGLVYRLKQGARSDENAEMLRQFLTGNVDYDVGKALKLLAEAGLDQLLFEYAMSQGLVIEALEVLAELGRYRLASPCLDNLIKKGFSAHIAQVASGAFLQCLDKFSLVSIFCEKPQLVAQYPDLLLDHLGSLEIGALFQMAEVLDPSRPLVRGYIQRKLSSRRRSSSLTSIASNWESLESSQRKDPRSQDAAVMVYCFLMVVLHLNRRRQEEGTPANLDFLFTNPAEFVQKAVESSQQSRQRLACRPCPVGAGQSHAAVVKGGDLYTWGKLANGRLGHGEPKSNQTTSGPCWVGTLRKLQIKVTSVACGLEHSLALTQQGVYGWGSSSYGQVGLGTRETCTRPMLLEGLSQVTCVAVDCGQYHSLALTEDAQVYSWGWAIHGQLGHCDVEERLVPSLVSCLRNQSIVKMAAGYCHTVFLNSQGELYACGSGYFGQLGLGNTTKETTPTKIDSIPEKVVTISTKYFHCLAVTVRGKVYQWGCHPLGLRYFVQQQRRAKQAGQPVFCQADEHLKPKLVDTSYVHGKIKQVVCGSLHSCIVTKTGDVYTWGKNLDGQLGNGTRQDIRIPQMVTHINDRQIVHLTSGGEFNVAMDRMGQVWVWGRNEHDQLGIKSSDVLASVKTTKPSVIKPVSGALTEVTVPVALTLQPGSPKGLGSLGYSFALERSLSYEEDDENDYDTNLSLPNLDTLGTLQYDRLVISVMLECVPGVCDCHQLLRRCLDLEDWGVATSISLHMQNYTQAMAYHYMALRGDRNHMEPSAFHESSIRVFNHYFGLVTKMEYTAPQKEELIKTILYQILYHWEVESLPMASLEECLDRTLGDTALFLAAVIFRSKETIEAPSSENPVLYKPTSRFLSSFSTKFCLKVTSTVLQKLQGNISNTEPAGFSLLRQLGEGQFSELSSRTLDTDKLPYDQLWQEIIQNLQKGLEVKKYIYVTHNELDRLEEQLGDTGHGQGKRGAAVFFTCGHFYTQVAFALELEKFGRDLRGGPLKLQETVMVLTEYYRRKDAKALACPRCVYSAIANM